jgi:hypothetical protein
VWRTQSCDQQPMVFICTTRTRISLNDVPTKKCYYLYRKRNILNWIMWTICRVSDCWNTRYTYLPKLNSVALVLERTIPTERPPLVGEVRANFCWQRSRSQGNGSPRPYSQFSRPEPLLLAPQLYSRGWVDPVPDPLLLRKSGSAGNGNRDLWISESVVRNSDH